MSLRLQTVQTFWSCSHHEIHLMSKWKHVSRFRDKMRCNFFFLALNHLQCLDVVVKCVSFDITDSPPNPQIEISGVLKEKESISITCSAVAPCPHFPPNLVWNLHDSPGKLEKNTDGTLITKIQKSMTLTDQSDGLNITCVACYLVNESCQTAKEQMTLRVTCKSLFLYSINTSLKQRIFYRPWCLSHVSLDAPKQTSVSISPPGLLSVGSWVSLNCSSRAKPPVRNFTWFRISHDGNGLGTKVSEGPVYSFSVTDGEVYYCVATNDLGKHASSVVHLTFKGKHATVLQTDNSIWVEIRNQ